MVERTHYVTQRDKKVPFSHMQLDMIAITYSVISEVH